MIDLHVHILPGLDDGAADLEEALAMARAAKNDGITCLVATPHYVTGWFAPEKGRVLEAVEELNRCLAAEGIGVVVLPGAEYRLEPDLPERYEKGELLTLGGKSRYLLVELPPGLLPPYAERVLFELQLCGVTPVLAHPERNGAPMHEQELLFKWAARGVLFQLTAASLKGAFGEGVRRAAQQFLRNGFVHLVASDAHSAVHRPPELGGALREVERILDQEAAQTLLANAERVVANSGKVAPVAGDERVRKQGFWSRLFGRGR